MTARLNPLAAAPVAMKTWLDASTAINTALEPTLAELVKIRASQINGCANCLAMHTAGAREYGESEDRLALLPAWREAPGFSDRERAALGWTEALTRLSEGPDHAAAYDALRAQFSEQEQVELTLIINVINGWNRIAVGFGVFHDAATSQAARDGERAAREKAAA